MAPSQIILLQCSTKFVLVARSKTLGTINFNKSSVNIVLCLDCALQVHAMILLLLFLHIIANAEMKCNLIKRTWRWIMICFSCSSLELISFFSKLYYKGCISPSLARPHWNDCSDTGNEKLPLSQFIPSLRKLYYRSQLEILFYFILNAFEFGIIVLRSPQRIFIAAAIGLCSTPLPFPQC